MPDGAGALVGRRLGDYRLEALLGIGGMAEVYRAYEAGLDRAVAVKVLPPALAADPDYVRRFRQEARRVAALRHPHIVPVYHYGEDEALLYLVMPILWESLRDRLDREGRLAPEEAIRRQFWITVDSGRVSSSWSRWSEGFFGR
jgi:serine/threonine protein kinase